MSDLEKLAEMFKDFPGIGQRQAKRFVYFLLRKNPNYRQELAESIKKVRDNVRQCSESFQYFYSENPNQTVSNIMLDQNRDSSKLMVVEKDTDLEAIEKSGIFDGHYFVLGGSVPVLDKTPANHIRLNQLGEQIKKRGDKLKEVIIATSLNPQGEHTANLVKDIVKENNLPFSLLGRGLSTGSELEYADKETLRNAFENRH